MDELDEPLRVWSVAGNFIAELQPAELDPKTHRAPPDQLDMVSISLVGGESFTLPLFVLCEIAHALENPPRGG